MGLVERMPSSFDARNTNVQFTEKGANLIFEAIIENTDEDFFPA